MGKKSRSTVQRVAARAAKRAATPLGLSHNSALPVVAISNTADNSAIVIAADTQIGTADPNCTPPAPEVLDVVALDPVVLDTVVLDTVAEPAAPTTEPVGTQPAAVDPHAALQDSIAESFAPLLSDPAPVDDDEPFELLSTLLVGEQRQQIAQMRLQVEQLQRLIDELEVQINDEAALVSTITPVIASAIRTNITESRDEMIDALYPIMGKLVQRSVTEAMRDLARRIDEQMRRTFNFKRLWRQLFARLHGVSDAEMALRNAFPFQVLQVFLIHRETGLLLMHCAQQTEETTDSDLISSMLTAIRDFTEDAFGRGQEAELNEIQYGDRSILIEVAHLVYMAAVVEGVLGSGFREQMRDTMITIEHQHTTALRTYDGDASRFDAADVALRTLLISN